MCILDNWPFRNALYRKLYYLFSHPSVYPACVWSGRQHRVVGRLLRAVGRGVVRPWHQHLLSLLLWEEKCGQNEAFKGRRSKRKLAYYDHHSILKKTNIRIRRCPVPVHQSGKTHSIYYLGQNYKLCFTTLKFKNYTRFKLSSISA